VTTSAASSGVTFYVSKASGSSDSNSGSQSSPWLTIGHAAATVTAGDTVIVESGTYNEAVAITTTGTSSAPIVFNGQGVATVDGTGLSCCTTPTFTLPPSSGFGLDNTEGLFTIGNTTSLNYVTVEGFIIQNFKTSSTSDVPAGILIGGGGTGIQILNNTVQNIQTTAGADGNAYGIGVFGTSSTPLSLTVSGNTVTGCLTGESETTTYNGNVQDFVVSNNTIYNNDNIGMDAIGSEQVGPTGYDQAKNGDVFGNHIYNNSAANNAGEASKSGSPDYDEDGVYCDGCTQVVFERNTLYGNDFGAEAASECSGAVSSYVVIRDNLIYGNNAAGVTLGGYSSSTASGCNGGGSSDHIYILNNTLYNNSTQSSGASGELQTQYRITNSYFENNIVYDGSAGLFILNQTTGAGLTLNYNDYYTTSSTPTWDYNGTAYTTFSTYQGASGEKESVFENPDYTTLPSCSGTYTPTGGSGTSKGTTCSALGNTDIPSTSPAFNTGNTGLGTPSGSSYSSYETSEPFVGSLDFNSNARINSSGEINMGAYEQ
jgi:hypothetical protein